MLPSPIIFTSNLLHGIINYINYSIFDKNQIKSTQQFDFELIINFVSIL